MDPSNRKHWPFPRRLLSEGPPETPIASRAGKAQLGWPGQQRPTAPLGSLGFRRGTGRNHGPQSRHHQRGRRFVVQRASTVGLVDAAGPQRGWMDIKDTKDRDVDTRDTHTVRRDTTSRRSHPGARRLKKLVQPCAPSSYPGPEGYPHRKTPSWELAAHPRQHGNNTLVQPSAYLSSCRTPHLPKHRHQNTLRFGIVRRGTKYGSILSTRFPP